jgi:hypothetical protein
VPSGRLGMKDVTTGNRLGASTPGSAVCLEIGSMDGSPSVGRAHVQSRVQGGNSPGS